MVGPNLGLRLRDKLGPEASQDLSDAFVEAQDDMVTIATERFDARLAAVECNLRHDMRNLREDMSRMESSFRLSLAEGLAKVRIEMIEMRADILRWSFLFWIGQFAATAAVLAMLLRWMPR